MRDNATGKRLWKWGLRMGALALAAAVGWIGWDAIKPMVMADAVAVYTPYTVEKGGIETDMSFSASINMRRRQNAHAEADVTVQKIFVEDGQQVAKDDKLIQLSNGQIVRAEIQGVVNEISVRQGDTVLEGDSLIDLCDFQNLEAVITVDEYDVENISVGQVCTVTVLPLEISFETQITSINRVSESPGMVAYYTVLAAFSAPEQVLPGMQATVSIAADQKDNAMLLDMGALAFDEENKPYVLRQTADGDYEAAYVEVGLNDGIRVEIIDGLAVGDTVYAQSGTETPQAVFSIQKAYNWIVGEKVVIREKGQMGTRPEGMDGESAMPPDGEQQNLEGAGQSETQGGDDNE